MKSVLCKLFIIVNIVGMLPMHQVYAAIDDSPPVYEYKTYSDSEDCDSGCDRSDFRRANTKLNELIAQAKSEHGDTVEVVQMNVSATQREGYYANRIGVFILIKYPKPMPKTQ